MMSTYVMSFAILGALLVAAPAMADYSLFMQWRSEFTGNKAISYDPAECEVVTLLTIGKSGELGDTDGTIWWDNYGNDAWTVQSNYQPRPSDLPGYWINFDGRDFAQYYEFGFALQGSIGVTGLMGVGATGLMGNIYLGIPGEIWYKYAVPCSRGGHQVLDEDHVTWLDYVTYLNGVKNSSSAINTTNDAQVTFGFDYFGRSDMCFGPSGGGFGIRFADALRNGSSFSIIAVRKPLPPVDVPEPATLAAVGLGLAGLGLARRRK